MDATTRPIGYWLSRLHNLLEEQFAQELSDVGLTRRQWQLMNLLSSGEQSHTGAARELTPFLQDAGTGEPGRLAEVLDGPAGLVTRGLVRHDPETELLGLTAQGREEHTAAAARVRDTRQALMRGLTPEQYAETVRNLAVMASNIETALADGATEGHAPDA